MTCRTEEGVAYIQTYNTENRISSIIKLASGTCAAPGPFAAKSHKGTMWDFAYDGDGVRVSTLLTPYNEIGTPLTPEMTSYYFGGAYETRSNGTTIKYYSFAGQTIAMDDGTGLQYFLTDHLGSVVATTDSTGTLISQQRYLPFGGVRPNVPSPSGPNTDLGYTGQRNLDADIGLMDYKARFYSPYLNRFVQPDTVIPNPANPQAYNRFSYVHNNPINFNDPSGHCAMDAKADDCFRPGFNNPPSLADYGVKIDPKMPYKEKRAILEAVVTVGDRFASERGKNESSAEAFRSVFGTDSRPLYYMYGNSSSDFAYDGSSQVDANGNPAGCNISSGACTVGSTTLANGSPVYLIKILTMSSNPLSARNNMVHELGHLFGGSIAGYTEMATALDQNPGINGQPGKYHRPSTSLAYGFASPGYPWQQATHNVGDFNEIFADQFLGWTFGMWEDSKQGRDRSSWMNENMPIWLGVGLP